MAYRIHLKRFSGLGLRTFVTSVASSVYNLSSSMTGCSLRTDSCWEASSISGSSGYGRFCGRFESYVSSTGVSDLVCFVCDLSLRLRPRFRSAWWALRSFMVEAGIWSLFSQYSSPLSSRFYITQVLRCLINAFRLSSCDTHFRWCADFVRYILVVTRAPSNTLEIARSNSLIIILFKGIDSWL